MSRVLRDILLFLLLVDAEPFFRLLPVVVAVEETIEGTFLFGARFGAYALVDHVVVVVGHFDDCPTPHTGGTFGHVNLLSKNFLL